MTLPRFLSVSPRDLISQWRDAPRFSAIVRDTLALIEDEIVTPSRDLTAMSNLDDATGVWLDYIGAWLGLARPSLIGTDDVARFGFGDAGVGFNQAPFAPVLDLAARPRIPMGDATYRRFLRARRITMRSYATTSSYLAAAREIDSDVLVADNHDGSITVSTRQVALIELANEIEALPVRAGLRITVQVLP